MEKTRADDLLVRSGQAASRSQARRLILEGRVSTPGGELVTKPGRFLPPDTLLSVKDPPRFVSRGGDKLAAYLEHFPADLGGRRLLDVGASTGGFTDCALQAGAASATCIDVGHGQLHPSLLDDSRVTNLEGVNARHLDPATLPHPSYDLISMDLSFISLTQVLPAVWPLLEPGGLLVALVKPQFEAGPEETRRTKGIIRDEAVRQRTLSTIKLFATGNLPGARVVGEMDCPVTGGDGNREFLLGLTHDGA
ncbi:TlyA family RNA methyltransferase [Ruficoccus amylovorans]|uniref:TlyA family RNA methyltransferase n=1 Tax=Ruficoccus amylovorans TaxID=1804625 RepID=A0A842HGE1_9BACT|nr:TlyA family RNA methyltransferase [Ruficoccus amylovorans]MBC2595359.1 TlyA family RNA methyltransferase [Ruficoccus amylovorans]